MAHLGDQVAAYVDGQLAPAAMRQADEHLASCEQCRTTVRQHRLLKSRMRTVAAPEPPAALLASLSRLVDAPAEALDETRWQRLCRSAPLRATVVLVGASMVVVALAYGLGSVRQRTGDAVTPPYDSYAADFFGPTATVTTAGNMITEATMEQLDGSGWPCHPVLAGDLDRVSAAFADQHETVALSYSNGTVKLNLFEQNGWLDVGKLEQFDEAMVGDAQVWVRRGSPTIVTWDADGVVYTIVTDADDERTARAIETLPTSYYEEDAVDRVTDGLQRMTAWVA